MQMKLIAIAVHYACRQIGDEWNQRQHIAKMAEAVERGRKEAGAK